MKIFLQDLWSSQELPNAGMAKAKKSTKKFVKRHLAKALEKRRNKRQRGQQKESQRDAISPTEDHGGAQDSSKNHQAEGAHSPSVSSLYYILSLLTEADSSFAVSDLVFIAVNPEPWYSALTGKPAPASGRQK